MIPFYFHRSNIFSSHSIGANDRQQTACRKMRSKDSVIPRLILLKLNFVLSSTIRTPQSYDTTCQSPQQTYQLPFNNPTHQHASTPSIHRLATPKTLNYRHDPSRGNQHSWLPADNPLLPIGIAHNKTPRPQASHPATNTHPAQHVPNAAKSRAAYMAHPKINQMIPHMRHPGSPPPQNKNRRNLPIKANPPMPSTRQCSKPKPKIRPQ